MMNIFNWFHTFMRLWISFEICFLWTSMQFDFTTKKVRKNRKLAESDSKRLNISKLVHHITNVLLNLSKNRLKPLKSLTIVFQNFVTKHIKCNPIFHNLNPFQNSKCKDKKKSNSILNFAFQKELVVVHWNKKKSLLIPYSAFLCERL